MASVETDRGVKEQLRLYDTKGLQDGQDLPKHYYSVADGFVLVYSVDSLESFRRVDVVKKEIDKSRDKKEARRPCFKSAPCEMYRVWFSLGNVGSHWKRRLVSVLCLLRSRL